MRRGPLFIVKVETIIGFVGHVRRHPMIWRLTRKLNKGPNLPESAIHSGMGRFFGHSETNGPAKRLTRVIRDGPVDILGMQVICAVLPIEILEVGSVDFEGRFFEVGLDDEEATEMSKIEVD